MTYTKCLRCHKPLRDRESRDRGYGPLCWQKHLQEEKAFLVDPNIPTLSDPTEALNTQHKLKMRVNELGAVCPNCQKPLSEGLIKSYDHSDGVFAKGYTKPQWFFVRCGKCEHDTAIWKLGIKQDDLNAVNVFSEMSSSN